MGCDAIYGSPQTELLDPPAGPDPAKSVPAHPAQQSKGILHSSLKNFENFTQIIWVPPEHDDGRTRVTEIFF